MNPMAPSSHSATTALIVFAKAPVAGLAKTRLIPALGREGAASLAARLLDHTVGMGVAADFDHLEICATPDTSHHTFQRLASLYPLVLTTQGEGDLGARMHRALARALDGHDRVLLVGTDAPSLDAAVLRQAAAALDTCDAVFVPALDGGYVLLGLRRMVPEVFSGIAWSTAGVMAQTRERLRGAGASWCELPPLWDVDEAADWQRLQALLSTAQSPGQEHHA